ncbi:unnamed protein product, partial [Trichogramma brassicae]
MTKLRWARVSIYLFIIRIRYTCSNKAAYRQMRVKSCVPRPGRIKTAAKKKKKKKKRKKRTCKAGTSVRERARNTCIYAARPPQPAKVCYGSLYTCIRGCSSSPRVFRSPRGRDRTSSRRPYLGPLINIEPQQQRQQQQQCISLRYTQCPG